jgi:hypothetical protein
MGLAIASLGGIAAFFRPSQQLAGGAGDRRDKRSDDRGNHHRDHQDDRENVHDAGGIRRRDAIALLPSHHRAELARRWTTGHGLASPVEDEEERKPEPARPEKGPDELVSDVPRVRDPEQDDSDHPGDQREDDRADQQQDEGADLDPSRFVGRRSRSRRLDLEALTGLLGDLRRVAEPFEHVPHVRLAFVLETGAPLGDVPGDLVHDLAPPVANPLLSRLRRDGLVETTWRESDLGAAQALLQAHDRRKGCARGVQGRMGPVP